MRYSQQLPLLLILTALLTACSGGSTATTVTTSGQEQALATATTSQEPKAEPATTTSSTQPGSSTTADPVARADNEAELTDTEFLVVGTWQIGSVDDPDRVAIGDDVGDTCSFASDLSLQCTISGTAVTGYWRAADPTEIDDVSMGPRIDWVFEVGGSSSGSSAFTIGENEMVLGSIHPTTWTLVEHLPRAAPSGERIDANTQQLIGSWTLVEADESRFLGQVAAVGDTCTFNPDHSLVCDGEDAPAAVWRTAGSWPEQSQYSGNSLEIKTSTGTLISAPYTTGGDALAWDTAHSVWERSG